MQPDAAEPESQLRSLQMTVVALILGVVVFAAIAATLGPLGTPFEPLAAGLDPIAIVATLLTISCAAMSFVVPGRLVGAISSDDPARKLAAYRNGKIVAVALLEGPALLWCVALLLGGNRWFLAPIAVLLVLMAAHFPTREAVREATGLRAGLD